MKWTIETSRHQVPLTININISGKSPRLFFPIEMVTTFQAGVSNVNKQSRRLWPILINLELGKHIHNIHNIYIWDYYRYTDIHTTLWQYTYICRIYSLAYLFILFLEHPNEIMKTKHNGGSRMIIPLTARISWGCWCFFKLESLGTWISPIHANIVHEHQWIPSGKLT